MQEDVQSRDVLPGGQLLHYHMTRPTQGVVLQHVTRTAGEGMRAEHFSMLWELELPAAGDPVSEFRDLLLMLVGVETSSTAVIFGADESFFA